MRNSAYGSNPGGSEIPRSENPWAALSDYRKHGDAYLRYSFATSYASKARVADFGCGYGYGALILADVVSAYVGVELDDLAIEWAKSNVSQVVPYASFQSSEQFTEAAKRDDFDVCIAFEVIEHVEDPKGLITDLLSVVKAGGVCLVSTPNGTFSEGNPALFRSQYHLREYSPPEFASLLSGFGYSVDFFREFRPDALDRIEFSGVKKVKPPGRLEPELARSPRYAMAKIARDLVARYFSYPALWRIERLGELSVDPRGYSTLVAVIRKQ